MHKAPLSEMEAYLRMLDSHLSQETRLVIIGGAAISFRWATSHATADVDLWNDPGREFWTAVQACSKLRGAVPISKVGVASPPLHFEDRLVEAPVQGLQFLTVAVPEAHDLALMKTVRAEAHDLDAIEDMHKACPLSLPVLIDRYQETLPNLIGPEFRLKANFLAVISRLFGEATAEELESRI